MRILAIVAFLSGPCVLQASEANANSVSWVIGSEASSRSGGQASGPVTFTWTFDRPVESGVYSDGTPWVVWQDGLKLVSVTPAMQIEDLILADGGILKGGIADATVINPKEGELPLDQRLGEVAATAPLWNGGVDVWNGSPVELKPGDCMVTGKSSRDGHPKRPMMFDAIGVCNIVKQPMTGHYRPPIRMPAELRANLVTPKEVPVASLPELSIPDPRDWNDQSVALDFSKAILPVDADDLMNGPISNPGLLTHSTYELSNGALNHDLSGRDLSAYQRNVSDRIAVCLYTAFDPAADPAKRQRSLNKFIQIGLDYYYMHSLGYPIWNGGGGHPNGVENAITIAGALLGDAEMTDAIKFQRFKGDAVGEPGKVYDMLSGGEGDFSRSEALHSLSSAPWGSQELIRRPVGQGSASVSESFIRVDFAHKGLALNLRDIPFTAVEALGEGSAIRIAPAFQWTTFTRHLSSEAHRGFLYIPGAIIRIEGDRTIRKVLAFQEDPQTEWTQESFNAAGGRGGVLWVYPPLTESEIQRFASGKLVMGVASKEEAERGLVTLWDSWTVATDKKVFDSFFTSPDHDYFDNKVGDQTQWLPFYTILDDPGRPGKKLSEESPTFIQVKALMQMLRDSGSHFWTRFASAHSTPNSPTNQALTRHVLLDGKMPDVFCKTYSKDDRMWVDE